MGDGAPGKVHKHNLECSILYWISIASLTFMAHTVHSQVISVCISLFDWREERFPDTQKFTNTDTEMKINWIWRSPRKQSSDCAHILDQGPRAKNITCLRLFKGRKQNIWYPCAFPQVLLYWTWQKYIADELGPFYLTSDSLRYNKYIDKNRTWIIKAMFSYSHTFMTAFLSLNTRNDMQVYRRTPAPIAEYPQGVYCW